MNKIVISGLVVESRILDDNTTIVYLHNEDENSTFIVYWQDGYNIEFKQNQKLLVFGKLTKVRTRIEKNRMLTIAIEASEVEINDF